MRLVADLVRGEEVNKALAILKFNPKEASRRLEKLLLSALTNWQAKNEEGDIEKAALFVKEIRVDGGSMLKRLRPGRRQLRRFSRAAPLLAPAAAQRRNSKAATTLKPSAHC